jgi:hypothetical protein
VGQKITSGMMMTANVAARPMSQMGRDFLIFSSRGVWIAVY